MSNPTAEKPAETSEVQSPENGIDPSTFLNAVKSQSFRLYNIKNPPPPELDCFGKFCNPNDVACVGDPAKWERGCVCFEECKVRTAVRNEQLLRSLRGEAPRKNVTFSLTQEELKTLLSDGLPEAFELKDNPDVKIGVVVMSGETDQAYVTVTKKNIELWGRAPIPGGKKTDDTWYLKHYYSPEEAKQGLTSQTGGAA